MNSMDILGTSGIGKPPARPYVHIYLLLSSALLLSILLAGGAFWKDYARKEPEFLAIHYYRPAAQLFSQMIDETHRLNERLLDDAWSGRTLSWDKKFRNLHYDHLPLVRKYFDSLLILESRFGERGVKMVEKAQWMRSVEGRLLALEEEWASAGVITALMFHEFATRELPILAKELIQLRRMHQEAGDSLLSRLESEQAFEVQVLTSSMALLLLFAWWGTRRGFRQIRAMQTVIAQTTQALETIHAEKVLLTTTAHYYPWVMDAGGTQFQQVAGEWMVLLGYPADAWVGFEEWEARIHPQDQAYATQMRRLIVAGETDEVAFEYRMLTADGAVVWVKDIMAMRLGEGAGLPRGYFVDITPEKYRLELLEAYHDHDRLTVMAQQAEALAEWGERVAQQEGEVARIEALRQALELESQKLQAELVESQAAWWVANGQLQTLLDHVQVAIALKGAQGEYLLVNRYFQDLFGVTAEAVIGQTDAVLFPESVVAELDVRSRRVWEDGGVSLTEEVLPLGEVVGLFSVARFPWHDEAGSRVGMFVVLVDVTERKIIEEELLGEVRLAKIQARNAGRAQARFLASMGHEVPSLVRGMVRMIHRLQSAGPPLRQQGRLELLAQSAAALMTVVEEFRSGTVALEVVKAGENFDLLGVLEETAGIFSRYAFGAGKRLHGRIAQRVPQIVFGDAESLRRLLALLLGNAIHAATEGDVLFSVQAHPQDAYRILFQVPAGNDDIDIEGDLAILERLSADMGGVCRLHQAMDRLCGESVASTGRLLSVIVQLEAAFEQGSGALEDEPVGDAV